MTATAEVQTRRFTVDEVLRMLDAGVLAEDEGVELLEGRLVVVSPQGREHIFAVSRLGRALLDAYSEGHTVYEEKPVILDETSAPEPDLAIARGSLLDHFHGGLKASDLILAVEVAQSSLDADRAKARLYARGGVPVYWLVDLVHRRVEVREDPLPEGEYRTVRILSEDDTLSPPGTDLRWPISDLLPPR